MSSIFKKIERKISGLIPHQHSADTRAAMGAAKAQLDYYKSSKEEMQKQSKELSDQKHLEQQKIHEKQIRALRRNFRTPGFLGTDSSAGVSDTLG